MVQDPPPPTFHPQVAGKISRLGNGLITGPEGVAGSIEEGLIMDSHSRMIQQSKVRLGEC